ncbi:hypothetical protein [Actinotignum urinale]|uniref:hypothetical protein n=1 Tax=Actinotignum urinale TaxID=190146 RepID=UPI0003B5541E|nr:hypothetical protein [Actinotignum urinale]MDY5159655.1 hypothetical protein [Actinotignum urinale]
MFTREYGLTGSERRPLVRVIEKALGVKAHCTRKPDFCYHFTDGIRLDNHGVLTIEDPHANRKLLDALDSAGYPTGVEKRVEMSISIPKDGFGEAELERLHQIIASKTTVIQKALGIDVLPIEVGEDTISFPWFPITPAARDLEAYIQLIALIAKLAKHSERILAKDHEVENERYYFRCFLLRLGMIGPEYKEIRKILLRNLEGSCAFKYYKRREGEA